MTDEGKLKPWPGKHHDLPELLAAAGADLVKTAHEQRFVAMLAASVKWGGRYPTPTSFQDMMPAAEQKPTVTMGSRALSERRALFESLFSRIEGQIPVSAFDP